MTNVPARAKLNWGWKHGAGKKARFEINIDYVNGKLVISPA